MSDAPEYIVRRASADFAPDANWDKPGWQSISSLSIDQYPWHEKGFKPRTQVKLQYTDDYVYLIYRVEDQFVRSVERRFNGFVCRDACVEIFFAPAESSPYYFNIETNCGGALLFRCQTGRQQDVREVRQEDAARLEIAHTMPDVVDPEIPDPVVWVNEYRIPLDVLEKVADVEKPAPGVRWNANFYKCAETCSNPHWGTWAPVDLPRPDFHRPEFFSSLIFG